MASQAQQTLRYARERFGPDTPAAIRREAAATLRTMGFSISQIEAALGGAGRICKRTGFAIPGTPRRPALFRARLGRRD